MAAQGRDGGDMGAPKQQTFCSTPWCRHRTLLDLEFDQAVYVGEPTARLRAPGSFRGRREPQSRSGSRKRRSKMASSARRGERSEHCTVGSLAICPWSAIYEPIRRGRARIRLGRAGGTKRTAPARSRGGVSESRKRFRERSERPPRSGTRRLPY